MKRCTMSDIEKLQVASLYKQMSLIWLFLFVKTPQALKLDRVAHFGVPFLLI